MVNSIIHCIDGAVATKSSPYYDIEGATKVQLICKRSAHASGNTVFSGTIAADVDGNGATAYAKWISNVANSNAEMLTRVASSTLGANGTALLSMSPEDIGGFLMITATETTDGTHDAWLIISYN